MKPCTIDQDKSEFFDLTYCLSGLRRSELRTCFVGQSIIGYAVPRKQSLEAAWHFRLYLENQLCFQFSSVFTMYDGWEEIGNLRIEKVDASADAHIFPVCAITPFKIHDLKCLFFANDKVRCEGGIVFVNELREEIILVASVSPGSVSVKAKFSSVPFYPQLDLEELEYAAI